MVHRWLVIIEKGKLYQDRMDKERVEEADILEVARKLQGLKRMDQIEYATIEYNGDINIIPMKDNKTQ
jgi:uncharacterized membrane protein YcaP (DUF421 family)